MPICKWHAPNSSAADFTAIALPRSGNRDDDNRQVVTLRVSEVRGLHAIITHKGRIADSGHYVGWVKRQGQWVEFDDDKIIPVEEEDIVKLNGGGDWHMAYLMVFKAEKN